MKHIKLLENYKKPEEFMLDLYNVGKTKAVGYLPYDNIKKYGNDSVENVIKWCELNNLKYHHFKPWEGTTGSGGAFYVYDYNMLLKLLEKYSDILINANIPIEPNAYISYIEKNIVDNNIYPEAYKVVAITFNDKRLYQ